MQPHNRHRTVSRDSACDGGQPEAERQVLRAVTYTGSTKGKQMKSTTRSWLLAVAAAVLCLTPNARADNLDLTSPGNGANAAGIYVGPYQGTINGGPVTSIICDDFVHDSYVGETWQATATNLGTGNLGATGSTLYGKEFGATVATADYDAAAYLANQLLTPGISTTTQTDLQYAIWYLFDPTQVASYLATFGSTYSGLLSAAEGDVAAAWLAESNPTTALTAAELAEFTIYTPTNVTSCPNGAGQCGLPQEFIVRTPEPSTLLLLGAGLCFLLVIARRKKGMTGSMSIA
jgi:PEP-CTERM motif